MEIQIDELLKNLKNTYIPSLKEIEEENINLINNIYSNYLMYTQNHENKKIALINLKNCHSIDFVKIKLGDYVKYISKKYFYDIELKSGGFVMKKNKASLMLKNNLGVFTVKSNTNFFRKLTNEELAKIKLIETINTL